MVELAIITRPMLAHTLDSVASLHYPVLVSPKLDGIRCLKVNGQALTRSFKPLPNTYVRQWIEANLIDNLDGELISLDEQNNPKSFNDIQSDIMSTQTKPNFTFNVFDLASTKPFIQRYSELEAYVQSKQLDRLKLVEHTVIQNEQDLLAYEQSAISNGYEGVMIRTLTGLYECKRSHALLKFKRFHDSEAIIVGFEEQMRNINQATTSELGLTKRSQSKLGLIKANTLGALVVMDVNPESEHYCKVFNIGTGFTQALRDQIWLNKQLFVGRRLKYKYQKHGQKDLPRKPVFIGFRDMLG